MIQQLLSDPAFPLISLFVAAIGLIAHHGVTEGHKGKFTIWMWLTLTVYILGMALAGVSLVLTIKGSTTLIVCCTIFFSTAIYVIERAADAVRRGTEELKRSYMSDIDIFH